MNEFENDDCYNHIYHQGFHRDCSKCYEEHLTQVKDRKIVEAKLGFNSNFE